MKTLLLNLVICFSFAGSAYANNAFVYQGRPISPNCLEKFMSLSSDTQIKQVRLSQCSSAKHANQVSFKNGVYTTQSNETTNQRPKPYSIYKTISNDGNLFFLLFGQWTGGSGFFTDIVLITKKNDRLILEKTLASGDRCNGGVSVVGPWEYGVALTSTDLILSASGKPIKITPYKDLDASAAGCVANAVYRYNPKTKKSKFMYIQLLRQANIGGDWATHFTYQTCFDKLFNSYTSKGTLKLNQQAVNVFVQSFKTKCLSKASKN